MGGIATGAESAWWQGRVRKSIASRRRSHELSQGASRLLPSNLSRRLAEPESDAQASNNDSCRDLNGRRLSTIKEAKKLAASIASEPEREALARKKAEERLAALNQEIARLDAAVNGGAGGSGAGSKRRLDDAEEGEKREEAKEKLRGAVASAMLKKRKKNKPSPPAASTSASSSSAAKAVEESTKAPAVAAV